MKARYSLLPLALFVCLQSNAQTYCAPSFANGCFNWRNLNISLGNTDWVNDGDCGNFDHTLLSATVNAGEILPMTVENGNWCGCAVWVDLDQSLSFEASENLYHIYVGGSPSYIYDFGITIPASTPSGAYRLRVIAPWGSDGFTEGGTNGFGPCGEFQYGNYDDFTLNVVNTTSIDEHANAVNLVASPNPTSGQFSIRSSGPIRRMTVYSSDGRTVLDLRPGTVVGPVDLDLRAQPDGIYRVRCETGSGTQVVRVVKL